MNSGYELYSMPKHHLVSRRSSRLLIPVALSAIAQSTQQINAQNDSRARVRGQRKLRNRTIGSPAVQDCPFVVEMK